MRRTTIRKQWAFLGFLLPAVAAVAACGGKTTSTDGTTVSHLDLGAPGAGGATLSSLSDDETTKLCQWLASEHPVDACRTGGLNPPPGPGWSPGCGVEVGCWSPASFIAWDYVSIADCVANVKASKCTATPDDVVRCAAKIEEKAAGRSDIDYAADFEAGVEGADKACIADETAACDKFLNDPACQTTVFHALFDPSTRPCIFSLPITGSPVCPPDAASGK